MSSLVNQLTKSFQVQGKSKYTRKDLDEFFHDGSRMFVERFVDLENPTTLLVYTSSSFNLKNHRGEGVKAIVDRKPLNSARRLNKFLESVNEELPHEGVFIGTAETKDQRKHRILRKYPKGMNWLVYTVDFLFHRVSPKIWGVKKVYFFLTSGKRRVLSQTEMLGRLVCCGFDILEYQQINGFLYFAVRKVNTPSFDMSPSYGPLFPMRRMGKNGKEIRVLKFRTMHPYSEYLQPYIFKWNSLDDGGKFKNDFRVTTLGKFMRKFWIDELPMILNVLRGDLKIFGVRPLSAHYLSLYTDEELLELRKRNKPGLIPPYYVDMPGTLDEIMASEKKYLKAYEKNPIITDLLYMYRAFINIAIKRARSK